MYVPKSFEQSDIRHMHELIRAYPLATLITTSAPGLNANHIPLQWVDSPSPHGILQGHIARANPLTAEATGDIDTLAIFHGPDAYISPSWYETKQQHGKVIPTWNYVAVHAYGSLRVVNDTAWLRDQLETFTALNEADFPNPWTLSDAPDEYIETLLTAIVGIEITITRLVGKWKVSQNQPLINRKSIAAGLSAGSLPNTAMADLVMSNLENND